MKLDILIPKYNEDEDRISCLLNTIAYQQGMDFHEIRSIICNDGGPSLSKEFLEKLPYSTIYEDKDHSGVSSTRNRLLDMSDADYIMCCDADDMFIDMRGLSYVFQAMNKDFDVFSSTFLEEEKDTSGRSRFVARKNDTHFVHGKVFKRQYLIDNDIRWKDEFEYSGDTYFLGLALITNKSHVYCSTPFYMWKWNGDSICRRNKDHYAREFGMKLRVYGSLIDELLEREMVEDAINYSLFVVYDGYYITQTEQWGKLESELKDEITKRFQDFYNKYRNLIEGASKKAILPVIKSAKFNQVIRGNIMEKITYDDWLHNHLLKE